MLYFCFQLREEDTKGFWEGQIGIKQRHYVDIKVPFEEVREIRDSSIFTENGNYSLRDLLDLFLSVPAFLKFAQAKGHDAWDVLLQKFISDFLQILDLPHDTDPTIVKLKTRSDYFVIMGRRP